MSCEKEQQAYDNARAELLGNTDPTRAHMLIEDLQRARDALDACKMHPTVPAPVTNVGQAMVTAGDHVYLFAVDVDGRVLYNRWKLGGGREGWREIGGGKGLTDAAPAAAAVGDYIFVSVKDAGNNVDILLNQGSGYTWVGWQSAS